MSAPLQAKVSETNSLNPNLEVFRPLLGKTWRAEFEGSTPQKPVVDVAKWERALNGEAVRVTHSINRGAYGGETLIHWDAVAKTIAYSYFTTSGFQTRGTFSVKEGRFTSHETVSGDKDGVTEVRSTGEINSDGRLVKKAEYLKASQWVPGHSATYLEDPKAEVVFR
jgi:hypothetical protein